MVMASMFRRNPRTKVTSLFREVFSEIARENAEQPIYVAIAVAAEECGMDEFDAEGIAIRLLEISEKNLAKESPTDKAHQPAAPAPGRKTTGFGTELTKWLGKLSTEQLCLWVAGYDLDKARILYCDTDIDDLSVMVDLKSQHEWQIVRTQFEACILGAGGKIVGQSDAIVHEVDMKSTEAVNDMITQMRAMGF